MTKEQKNWIDNASYEQLLKKWRFAPTGDPYFQNECGKYFGKIMNEKSKTVDTVQASKNIGWQGEILN